MSWTRCCATRRSQPRELGVGTAAHSSRGASLTAFAGCGHSRRRAGRRPRLWTGARHPAGTSILTSVVVELVRRAGARGGVFTVGDAEQCGYGRSRRRALLTSGAWVELRRGVYAAQDVAGLMDAYRKAGATQAAITDLRVTQLDNTTAIATVQWNALAADGALLRDFTTSYQLLRVEGGGWRILSYTYHHG